MQRAYDNVIHDVALQNLDMVICLDRAGLVGADGATHHGVFDLVCFRPVPNLTISAPMDEVELRNLMYTAQIKGMDLCHSISTWSWLCCSKIGICLCRKCQSEKVDA